MMRIGIIGQQKFDHPRVPANTSQGKRGVVIIGRSFIDVGSFHDEELDRAEMTRPARLHQRSSSAFALVFLGIKKRVII